MWVVGRGGTERAGMDLFEPRHVRTFIEQQEETAVTVTVS